MQGGLLGEWYGHFFACLCVCEADVDFFPLFFYRKDDIEMIYVKKDADKC